MNAVIRNMLPGDRAAVLAMMRTFYASPAVLSNGSEEIFQNDFDHCVGDSPYAEGFVAEWEGRLLAYAMVAKSYSTEFGKCCIWVEDLYVQPDFRGMGLGTRMLEWIGARFPGCVFRLEVEAENEGALAVYRKNGFEVLPYLEMKKE